MQPDLELLDLHAIPAPAGHMAQTRGQMGLAHPDRAQQQDVVVGFQEA